MGNVFEWDDLLEYIEEGRVVPLVGEQLLKVGEAGSALPLYDYVAERLVERIGMERSALPEHLGLNELVCAHLKAGGDVIDLYAKIPRILREASFQPPQALLQLAGIKDFGLFVSLTFDSLLAQAIDQARFGGAAHTLPLIYTPNGRDQAIAYDDLPKPWNPELEPLVFHLFGKASASPDYAVSDEDLLEFVHALQQPDRRPPRLFDELANKHLLFLGCRYSDWLARFILRLSKNKRLSDQRTCRETLVDTAIEQEHSLVVFCSHFSRNTRLLPQSAEDFIAELSRRWQARNPPGGSPGSPSKPTVTIADMPQGAIFISYASEDQAIAHVLHESLEREGLDAWLDREDLEPGDHWDGKIRRNIEQCSLFIPLVSSHTEQRGEGYFRKEWRWAAERAEGIADGIPFILPLRIDYDGTPDNAEVPPAFRRVQWSFWAEGPIPAFLAKLREAVRAYHKRRRA